MLTPTLSLYWAQFAIDESYAFKCISILSNWLDGIKCCRYRSNFVLLFVKRANCEIIKMTSHSLWHFVEKFASVVIILAVVMVAMMCNDHVILKPTLVFPSYFIFPLILVFALWYDHLTHVKACQQQACKLWGSDGEYSQSHVALNASYLHLSPP